MRITLIAWMACLLPFWTHAQSSDLRPDDRDWLLIERMMVRHQLLEESHLSIRNYRRDHLNQAFLNADWNGQDSAQWHRLLGRHNDYTGLSDSVSLALRQKGVPESRKGIWNTFYTNPFYFFQTNQKGFYGRINPIIYLSGGDSRFKGLFHNTRGVDLRGGIDGKVFFQFEFLENQVFFPSYVDEFIQTYRALPQNGLIKGFSSDLLGLTGGRDFQNSRGSVSWQFSKHITGRMGYGRNFIGDGLRSLILSDFSNNYFYGRIDTRIWKFHYTNLWGQLAADNPSIIRGDNLITPKWFALHYFSIHINPALRFGVYEKVMFHRGNGFDINYLVPIIFYRSIEHALGSPDNALLGADFRWDLARRWSVYGQLTLDEFTFSELFGDTRGWWGNKYGVQLGVKYFDAFNIPHLTAQAEVNWVRPFTYTHRDSLRAATHYNMPLAHPLGANFQEYLVHFNYQPAGRWSGSFLFMLSQQGRSVDENVGWNITESYDTRSRDDGFDWLEGQRRTVTSMRLKVNYELYPGVLLRSILQYRDQEDVSRNDRIYNDFMWTVGVSVNFDPPGMDF